MMMGTPIWIGMTHSASGSDITPPVLVTAIIDASGTILTLTYNKNLDSGSVPATGNFALGGTIRTVSLVGVTGNTVILTLSGSVTPAATINISYTAGISPIRDNIGNLAANLSGQNVTNNSGINPITSGLILELDSSDGYLTYDGSNRISTWSDKSGVGNHGTTAAGLPLRVTNVLDGKNAVRFDTSAIRIGRTSLVGGTRSVCTVVLVVQKTNNVGAQILCGNAAASTTFVVRTDTTQWGISQGSTQSEAVGTADTSPHIIIATFDSTDTLHIDNMSSAKVSTSAGGTTADGWFLGRSSNGALFDCFAHLIYNRALSQAERTTIKGYLRAVYPSLPA